MSLRGGKALAGTSNTTMVLQIQLMLTLGTVVHCNIIFSPLNTSVFLIF